PSLKGYRYYVDNLVKPVKIDSKSVRSIQSLFGNEYRRVDEIIEMSAKILSDLTNYTAITLRPEASDLKLEGFRMVPLGNGQVMRSDEHTSELQSRFDLVCRLLLENRNFTPVT